MNADTLYAAQIIHDETQEIVRQSAPTYKRRAEKIEDGMGINLNWTDYSTRLVMVDAAGNLLEVV